MTKTWEKYTARLDSITSITKHENSLVIKGNGPHLESTITLHTKDVEALWFSIKQAQNKERLRTLKEDRLERIKRGRIC